MNKLVPWDFLLFTGILIIVVAVFNYVFELCSEVVVKVDRDTINGIGHLFRILPLLVCIEPFASTL